MKKLIAILITSTILSQCVPSVLAQSKGDWEAVKATANRPVAVQTKSGKTLFGLVQWIDDSSLQMEIAAQDDLTGQSINIPRDEVEKVWRASLRFGNNVTKASLIGVGVGVGVVFTVGLVKRAQHSSDPMPGAVLVPLGGGAAGTVAGWFWKKKHKKKELIYST